VACLVCCLPACLACLLADCVACLLPPLLAAGTSPCGPASSPLSGSVCYNTATQCCADATKALIGQPINGVGCYAYPYCPFTIQWGSTGADTTQILGERAGRRAGGARQRRAAATALQTGRARERAQCSAQATLWWAALWWATLWWGGYAMQSRPLLPYPRLCLANPQQPASQASAPLVQVVSPQWYVHS